ncbi:MAG: GAF domain-containing protein [Salinibacterium sp.]|nr:GAF domain-containing protein [Salinibacterium sp.]
MTQDFVRFIVHRVVSRMLINAIYSAGALPQPEGDPRVHRPGPDPDRILIVGGGAVRGLGVASHELGIGGHIAQQLSALTGRGVDLELRGVPGLTAAEVPRVLSSASISHFDVLVVMVGTREALYLPTVKRWAREMRTLMARIAEISPPSLSVVIAGVPPLPTALPLSRQFGSMVGKHVAALNVATVGACAAAGYSYVSFSQEPDGKRSFGDTSIYSHWAGAISGTVAATLDAVTSRPLVEPVDEERRLVALDAMDIFDSPPSIELDRLVRTARNLFGVDGVAVNLVDRERTRTIAASGAERGDAPRVGSFCTLTVRLGGFVVADDTLLDSRVSHLRPVQDYGVRFYAAYPIEAPSGERIGTLCLFDGAPREFSMKDRALLRGLALQVQAELWSEVPASLGLGATGQS